MHVVHGFSQFFFPMSVMNANWKRKMKGWGTKQLDCTSYGILKDLRNVTLEVI